MKNIEKRCVTCGGKFAIPWRKNLRHSKTKHCSLKCRLLSYVVEKNGCWEMTNSLDPKGYGRLTVDGKQVPAHRISFSCFNGPIPEGHHVCHRCDKPACVNPDHLFTGTNHDNVRDMHAKGRARKAFGLQSSNGKLSEKQVVEIRSSTARAKDLASKFGVKSSTISNIRSGRLHKHLT